MIQAGVMIARWRLRVDKDRIGETSLADGPAEAALLPGEIEASVTRFALTANNVTYAVFGRSFGQAGEGAGYWDFFPDQSGAGLVPVWGFATVTRSACVGIAAGTEYYGYFPLASHWTMRPGRIAADQFWDMAEHRAKLPGVYNQYLAVDKISDYRAADRDLWPACRPLLVTGFMMADALGDAGFHGAEQIVISSASSKTAMMFAHALKQMPGSPKRVGLTSPANRDFVTACGFYDSVSLYSDIEWIDEKLAAISVDLAGNGEVIRRVHEHFGAKLKFSQLVGKAHWDAGMNLKDLPGPRVMMFFAPREMQKKAKIWGKDGMAARVSGAWRAFIRDAPALRVDLRQGPAGAKTAYAQLVGGKTAPRDIVIVAV